MIEEELADYSLLQVLEYLATREILTSEHINGGPRYPGVERSGPMTITFLFNFSDGLL